MPETYGWQLMLCTDSRGHPTTALLMGVQENGQLFHVADDDFGPFDRMDDLTRFLLKAVHCHLGRQPR